MAAFPTALVLLALCARGASGTRTVLSLHEAVEGKSDEVAIREGQGTNTTACAGVSAEVLQVAAQCKAAAGDPAVLARFPNLAADWCDRQLSEISSHICASEEEDRLRTAAMVEMGLRRVTQIISASEEGLASEGAWTPCSKLARSCSECESRFAGAREFAATSHACEWRAGACERAEGARRPRPWGQAAEACKEDPATGSSFLQAWQEEGANSTGGGKKIALLVGWTYEGKNRLPGTYTDIKNVFRLLTEQKGFDPRGIFVIYDQGNPRDFVDRRTGLAAQILPYDGTGTKFWEHIQWLLPANRVGPGDFALFWFSGHGAQTEFNPKTSELDGKDEWLVAPNFDRVMDDDFYTFLTTIPRGVKATVVVDACHSEGFSDLPFNYNAGNAEVFDDGVQQSVGFAVQRQWCTDIAQAVPVLPSARITFISGSQNHQTSSDLGEQVGGALTSYALENWARKVNPAPEPTTVEERVYEQLTCQMCDYDDSLYNRFKHILAYFKARGISQEPNVCAWPLFSDRLDFDPFTAPAYPYGTAGYLIDFQPFSGGKRPTSTSNMNVPPICPHGGRYRANGVTMQSLGPHATVQRMRPFTTNLDIQPSLADASKAYSQGDYWVGWLAATRLQLPPTNPNTRTPVGLGFRETAPDVVTYVVQGTPGHVAGILPGDIIRSIDGTPFSTINPAYEKTKRLMKGGTLEVVRMN